MDNPSDDEDGSQHLNDLLRIIDDPSVGRVDKFAAFRALTSVLPTIGTCGICGGDLKYEGLADRLVVACVFNTKHRWAPSGERIDI